MTTKVHCYENLLKKTDSHDRGINPEEKVKSGAEYFVDLF